MTYAKRGVWMAAAAAVLIIGVVGSACSDLGATTDARSGPNGPSSDKGTSSSSGGSGAGEAAAPAFGAPSATGVVLVHAAAFPSFRLCFENSPELLPQPDSKVMPQANVVGVEVGSVVRINPLKAPGKIYVINEKAVRSVAGDPTDVPCGQLLTLNGSHSLVPNNDFHVATAVNEPLGQSQVHVLAITGCGSEAFLDAVSATSADCGSGSSRPWDTKTGNLEARVIPLMPSAQGATASQLPVQLLHVAPALEAQRGTATLEVTFGALAGVGTLPQAVASKTALLTTTGQVALDVNQSSEAVYGTHGFRIALVQPDGGTKSTVDQSLAAVQDLSSPGDVPTSYYRVASNYALLLLGDPSVPATLAGGAPNPDRRRLHLLAVPVLDPSQIDAGVDSGASSTDGGAQ